MGIGFRGIFINDVLTGSKNEVELLMAISQE